MRWLFFLIVWLFPYMAFAAGFPPNCPDTTGNHLNYLSSTNAYLCGNSGGIGTITLSGDVSGSGTSAIVTTLATVNSNVGTFGSATQVPQLTANGKGLITGVASVTVTPAWSSITSTPTTLSGYGITSPLPIVQGGTGTTTPSLVPGTNITISGSWPNQTINASGGGGMSIGGAVTSGTAGSILYVGSGPVLAQDNANLFWDSANHELGIGTTAPIDQLHIYGKSPVSVATIATSSTPNQVVTQGNYAYVIANGNINIYDTIIPSAPVLISTTAADTGSRVLLVLGNYLYTGGTSKLQIWDISQAAAPHLFTTASEGVSGGVVSALWVSGQALFAAGYNPGTTGYYLGVYDISTIPPNGITSGSNSSYFPSLINVGKIEYYIDNTNGALFALDTAYPINNVNKIFSETATDTLPIAIASQGKYIWVLSQGASPGSLQAFDVSDPSNPIANTLFPVGVNPTSLFIQGHLAYITNQSDNTLQVIDISNAASPVSLWTVSTGTAPTSVTVQGRYAYVTNSSSNTLQVFDVGGAYVQQLEAGGIQTSSIDVNGFVKAQDMEVLGGMQIGNSFELGGSFAALGNGHIAGISYMGSFVGTQMQTTVAPTVTQFGSTGATVRGYKIVVGGTGGSTSASAEGTISNGAASLSSTNYVEIKFQGVAGATNYQVYRTTGGTVPRFLATLPVAFTGQTPGQTYVFHDTSGTNGSNITPPVINTTGKSGITNYNVTPTAYFQIAPQVAVGGTPGSSGQLFQVAPLSWMDAATAASGTATNMVFNSLGSEILTAQNTSVTTTNAYNLFINGAPIASTNQTTTNTTALNIASAIVNGASINSYGLQVNAMTGASNNYAAVFNGGNVGIGSTTPLASLDIGQKTDAIILPIGTTTQRPGTGVNGMLRYNSTLSAVEAYQGNVWSSIGAGGGAEMQISYQPGLLTAINATKGVYGKFVKSSTVDNIEGSAITFSCIANPTITLTNCHTDTACATTPTAIGTVTVTASGQAFDGTITSASILAGEYIGWSMTAGTCASIDISATAQIHAN